MPIIQKPSTARGAEGLRITSNNKQSKPITPDANTATTNRTPRPGHTIIDLLIARAGVLCVLGDDYNPTIAVARKLAELAERRGVAQ